MGTESGRSQSTRVPLDVDRIGGFVRVRTGTRSAKTWKNYSAVDFRGEPALYAMDHMRSNIFSGEFCEGREDSAGWGGRIVLGGGIAYAEKGRNGVKWGKRRNKTKNGGNGATDKKWGICRRLPGHGGSS